MGPPFKRSWFSRMWTIQEVTLPLQDHIQILCESILLLLGVFGSCTRYAESIGLPVAAMRLRAYLSRLLTEKRKRSVSRPRLLDILLYGRKRNLQIQKTESLPCLAYQELDITVPSSNYLDPLSRIYATATVACFTNDSSMEFFYNVPSDSRRTGLPSWAVD